MNQLLAQAGGVDDAVAGAAGIPVAFLLGVVSFFTPCILPLVPGYLSYISGLSGEDLEAGTDRRRVFLATLLFVLGFAILFTLLGAGVGALGGLLGGRRNLLNRIGGAIVILMGLAFLSSVAVGRLQRWASSERRAARIAGAVGMKAAWAAGRERALGFRPRAGLAGALPLGAAFAVGWIPCVGPALGAIYGIAATEGTALRGGALLFSFSLGFGVWFILGGLAFQRAARTFAAIRRRAAALTTVGGLFLLTIGVLLITNQWDRLLAPLRAWVVRFTPPI